MREDRARSFSALGERTFDLLVVGGGITGCGVARDAALRGLSVALVEKGDFASGTSSRSSKLVHGGLRYLEHGQLRLVFEGTHERALLLRMAPHLVRPLPFIYPAYRGTWPGLFAMSVGLWLYDGLSLFSSPKLHRSVGTQKLLELEPGLRGDKLSGGVVYYDCTTDDARLTLENAMDARQLGAVAVNYAKVLELIRSESGQVEGARVADALGRSGEVSVRAKVVVNASGPWTNELRQLAGQPPLIKPTKGVHLVVDAARLPVRHAVVMRSPKDHRVMFAIPWGERTVLGTTDTYHGESADEVFATPDDAAYILETANHAFPRAQLAVDDIWATWAGLRPLIQAQSSELSASDVSREHQVFSQPGFVTIAGGKLTTYRRIAAEVVDQAAAQLGVAQGTKTADRPLPGASGLPEGGVPTLVEKLVEQGLEPALAAHWAYTYGAAAPKLAERAAQTPDAQQRLSSELLWLMAEVDRAVEEEFAVSLQDVLCRRSPLFLKARDQGLSAAEPVAQRMARQLGWDPAHTREEVDRYREAVEQSRRFRG